MSKDHKEILSLLYTPFLELAERCEIDETAIIVLDHTIKRLNGEDYTAYSQKQCVSLFDGIEKNERLTEDQKQASLKLVNVISFF